MAKDFSLYRSKRSCIAPALQVWPSISSLPCSSFLLVHVVVPKLVVVVVKLMCAINVEEAPPSSSLNSPSIPGSLYKAIASECRRWRKWYEFCLLISVLVP
ncbi:hypothetical protein KC19_VG109500 [Ceratodon purpureus]|uniref:Uncharacterized protein n=1 Tax=Ceratodon purpureus TaxID=3225 RepID=A0A8T0HPS1_CERPU|nr:hypothetical protein KC19_VG109500 [Ceratodon purpureus]